MLTGAPSAGPSDAFKIALVLALAFFIGLEREEHKQTPHNEGRVFLQLLGANSAGFGCCHRLGCLCHCAANPGGGILVAYRKT